MSVPQNVFSIHSQKSFSHSPKKKQDEDLLRMHQDGLSYREISEALGLSKSTIARRIKSLSHVPGVPPSQSGTPKSLKNAKRKVSHPSTVPQIKCPTLPQTTEEEKIVSEKIAYLNKQIESFENNRKTELSGINTTLAQHQEELADIRLMIKKQSETIDKLSQLILSQVSHPETERPTSEVSHCPTSQVSHETEECHTQSFQKISWNGIFSFLIIGFISLITTGYLIDTARSFYTQKSGAFWGLALAIAFELFILVLAVYRPMGRVAFRTVSEFLSSVPVVSKWLVAKVLLIGMCAYSFTAVTVSLDKETAVSLSQVSHVSSSEIEAREKYRDSLLEALDVYTKARATGNIKKTQEQISKVNQEITTMKESAKINNSGVSEAIVNEKNATKWYRGIALLINVVLGHVVAGMVFGRKQ